MVSGGGPLWLRLVVVIGRYIAGYTKVMVTLGGRWYVVVDGRFN